MGNNPISRTDANGGEDYNEIGIDTKTGKSYTLSNLGGDEYDVIHHGRFNSDFSDLTHESPDEIIFNPRPNTVAEGFELADKVATPLSIPFGVTDIMERRIIGGVLKSSEEIAEGVESTLKWGGRIGGALGAVGALHSIYVYNQHPTKRNATKAVYNTVIAILGATIAPEAGVIDAVFDASGLKEKALDKIFGEEKQEHSMPTPQTPGGVPTIIL